MCWNCWSRSCHVNETANYGVISVLLQMPFPQGDRPLPQTTYWHIYTWTSTVYVSWRDGCLYTISTSGSGLRPPSVSNASWLHFRFSHPKWVSLLWRSPEPLTCLLSYPQFPQLPSSINREQFSVPLCSIVYIEKRCQPFQLAISAFQFAWSVPDTYYLFNTFNASWSMLFNFELTAQL